MAVGSTTALPGMSERKPAAWTEMFRCFQIALDPRKLLVAGVGLLAMSLGWYLLSLLFYHDKPNRENDSVYGNAVVRKILGDKNAEGKDYEEADFKNEADRMYKRDLAQWVSLHEVAGPGGRLRTLPWYEDRGPNPFLLLTTVVGGTALDIQTVAGQFLSGTLPVLVEPLRKLLIPVFKLFDPNATFVTRMYCILCLLWAVVVWAFAGGVITRIAAIQFANKESITLPQAIQFVLNRYLSYLLSPIVPICVIFGIILLMAIYGLVAMVPIFGDIVSYGLLMPLVFLGGVALSILLIGLIGYPLMYTTISAEGSDTFDALSRSYNYVFQAPWSYLSYAFIAVLYGAAVMFFVVFLGSLSVFMGKYAVSQAPWSEASNRKPDFLFINAPESFGWQELLVKGSPIEVEPHAVKDEFSNRTRMEYKPKDPVAYEQYKKSYTFYNWIGTGMVTFWTTAVLLLVIGFSYSYFWSASTIVYLLMRKKVDETEIDEVYVEEDSFDSPLPSIGTTVASGPAAAPVNKLPTVDYPAATNQSASPKPAAASSTPAASTSNPVTTPTPAPPSTLAATSTNTGTTTTPAQNSTPSTMEPEKKPDDPK